LVRKILETSGASINDPFEESTLLAHLLKPTRIYVRSLLALMHSECLQGAAHITGGGLPDNLPRVYSETLQAKIDLNTWKWPAIFQWLQTKGNVAQSEMLRTFNCGIGMVVIVCPTKLDEALQSLKEHGETPVVIGSLQTRLEGAPSVEFTGELSV
jgi:phosphoribosylformylglycinamidine cyclo-ligase